jgi:hypothetical protein
MAKVENVEKVVAYFGRRTAESKASDNGSVIVGFTAAYALFVHESLEMKLAGLPRTNGKGNYWDPQGRAQAKFLEQPAREMTSDGTFAGILRAAARKGLGLIDGLLLCGLRLQREAQLRCPVDTGNLKASAFTRKE